MTCAARLKLCVVVVPAVATCRPLNEFTCVCCTVRTGIAACYDGGQVLVHGCRERVLAWVRRVCVVRVLGSLKRLADLPTIGPAQPISLNIISNIVRYMSGNAWWVGIPSCAVTFRIIRFACTPLVELIQNTSELLCPVGSNVISCYTAVFNFLFQHVSCTQSSSHIWWKVCVDYRIAEFIFCNARCHVTNGLCKVIKSILFFVNRQLIRDI